MNLKTISESISNAASISNAHRCNSCRWFEPGTTYPHFKERGYCIMITSATAGSDTAAKINPLGTNSLLNVSAYFGCILHESKK